MKSIYLLLYSISILFLSSCQNDSIRTDSRFETDIISNNNISGKAFVYAPDSLTISLSRRDKKSGSYNFHYEIINGKGDVFINNETLEPGKDKLISSNLFNVIYFPVCQGEHQIKFTFSNADEFVTEAIYSVSVDDYSLKIIPENNLGKAIINEPFCLKFNLITNGLNNQCFNTTFDILSGEGQVTEVNPYLKEKLNSRSSSVYALTPGKNEVYYIPRSAGVHHFTMNIQNEFGYLQKADFNFNTNLPDFSVDIKIDTTIQLDEQGLLSLTIGDSGMDKDKEYYLTYRFLENSGKLQQNNNIIEENTLFVLKKGNYKYTFIPTIEGKVAIEFIVKDKFNSTKKGILEFNVLKSSTEIEIKNYVENIYLGNENNFSFAIKKGSYTGKFSCGITTIPGGAGEIKINDDKYTNGKKAIVDIHNTKVTFLPALSGKITILLHIYDEKDKKTTKEIHYNISEQEESIFLQGYSPILNTLSPLSMSFDIHKTGYTGDYQCDISAPANAGKIKLNGKDYVGKTAIKATGNTLLFTAEKTGEVALELKVADKNGNIIRKSLPFTVTNSPMDIKLSEYQKELNIGEKTSFGLTISKPDYAGKFRCSVITESGNGQIKVNNEISSALSVFEISNNTLSKIDFLPNKIGDIPLLISVFDGIEQREFTIVFSVENPIIKMDVVGFNATSTINVENNFNFSLIKEGYTGKYNYNITTTPANAGKIKINGKNYDGGTQLFENTNNIVGFTPAINGKISLNIAIADAWGGILERNFTYDSKPAELQFRFLSAIDENIRFESGSSFNFSVSQNGNYTGKYYLEVIHSGCKTLKINNVVYTSGKIEISDPTNIPIQFLPSSLQPVQMQLLVSDNIETKIEKKLTFLVNDTDINLSINNSISDLITGIPAIFSFSASSLGYTGKFKYKIAITSGTGHLKINEIDYSGEEIEINAGESVPVFFTPFRSGNAEIKVIIKDNKDREKSKSISYAITNPTMIFDIRSFNPSSNFHTTNHCYFSITSEKYFGSYNYSITTIPANAGKFIISEKLYPGGDVSLENPENSKLSFLPEITGKIKAILTITNDFGDKLVQNLEYNVENHPLGVILPEIETGKIFPVGKETAFTFSTKKDGYTGRFFCEVTGKNCSHIKLNDKTIQGRVEVNPGNNTLCFLPTAEGKEAVSIHLKITNDFGECVEKTMFFSTTLPDIDLSFIVGETTLLPFQSSSGIFIPTSEVDSLISYTLSFNPSGVSTLIVGGKPYMQNTPVTAPSGKPIPVIFTPDGSSSKVSLKVLVKDKFGGHKEKTIDFTVNNTPLSVSLSPLMGTVVLNQESVLTLTTSKPSYSGKFYCKISGENFSNPKINGIPIFEKIEIKKGENSVSFVPTIPGKVTLKLSVFDEWGMEIEKEAIFTCNNTDINLNLVNGETTLAVGSESSFTFIPIKGKEILSYKLAVSPASSAFLKIKGKEYNGGEVNIASGISESVTFVPTVAGVSSVFITVKDKFGGSIEKTVRYTVSEKKLQLNGLDLFTDGTKELFILEQAELQLSANRKTGVECSIVRKDQRPFSNKIKFSVNGEETTRFTLGETPVRFGIFPKEFGENEYLLNITDGEEKLQYPLSFKAICKYDFRQVPVTMTFTKSSVDNIDRKIDLNEANTIKSDFWRLVGNGFTWYFDKSSDIPDHGIQSSLNPRQTLLFPAGKSEITVPVGTINVPYFSNITSDVSIDMNLTQRLCHITGAFNCEYSGTLDFNLVSESETKSWKTPAINFTTGFMIPVSYLDKVTSINFHSKINIVNKPVVLETLTSESYPLKAGVISEIIDLAILKTSEYYNPLYDCKITVSPADAGKLSVKKYLHKGGFVIEELNTTSFTHEARTQVYFTPTSTSGESVTFYLKVTDKNGTNAEKTVKYTISK